MSSNAYSRRSVTLAFGEALRTARQARGASQETKLPTDVLLTEPIRAQGVRDER